MSSYQSCSYYLLSNFSCLRHTKIFVSCFWVYSKNKVVVYVILHSYQVKLIGYFFWLRYIGCLADGMVSTIYGDQCSQTCFTWHSFLKSKVRQCGHVQKKRFNCLHTMARIYIDTLVLCDSLWWQIRKMVLGSSMLTSCHLNIALM